MTDIVEQSPSEPDRPSGCTDAEAAGAPEIPEVEDSNAPDTAGASIKDSDAEDDLELLDPASRVMELASESDDNERQVGVFNLSSSEQSASAAALADDSSDTDSIVDDSKPDVQTKELATDWSNERSAHRIAVELKHVEAEVRKLLENFDSRRKRRLGGTRRWHELEEDIISWRFTGRPDEETLAHLAALVAKRHHLFNRLEFLTTIRPGWRSQPS